MYMCVCGWGGGWEEGESVEGEGSDPPIIQLGSHVRSCVGGVHAWINLEALGVVQVVTRPDTCYGNFFWRGVLIREHVLCRH